MTYCESSFEHDDASVVNNKSMDEVVADTEAKCEIKSKKDNEGIDADDNLNASDSEMENNSNSDNSERNYISVFLMRTVMRTMTVMFRTEMMRTFVMSGML